MSESDDEAARQPAASSASPSGGATRVATGVACSRALGFLREMVLAYFFGAGPHADVFRTALRGPNLLQNLLGEQTLSASFIPVYSRLLAAGRREDAGRFAGAVFGLLLAVAAAISLIGVLLAEPIVGVLAPGYLADAGRVADGAAGVDRYPLAVRTVRIIFPMTGVLVLSAWALGVLNSHRRFLLPYLAPALWNASIIAALLWTGRSWGAGSGPQPAVAGGAADRLLIAACLGALAGGVLQFAVQLPAVMRLLRGFRFSLSTRVTGVREALGAFVPLLAGRGAVQLSSYLDILLASFLAAGALGALGWAQTLYLLPISLFGMSVAAAELPEIARRSGAGDHGEILVRLRQSQRQMTFFTLPTGIGYLAFGYLIVGGLFRRGQFGHEDNWLVYLVLCSYSLGLLASTSSRLLTNVFYALGRTAVPARIAVERVALSAALGIGLMLWLDRISVGELLALEDAAGKLYLGAVGLALGAALSSWYELWRLRDRLRSVLGSPLPSSTARLLRLAAIALLACVPALGVWLLLAALPRLPLAALVVAVFAAAYLGMAAAAGLSELGRWAGFAGRR